MLNFCWNNLCQLDLTLDPKHIIEPYEIIDNIKTKSSKNVQAYVKNKTTTVSFHPSWTPPSPGGRTSFGFLY